VSGIAWDVFQGSGGGIIIIPERAEGGTGKLNGRFGEDAGWRGMVSRGSK